MEVALRSEAIYPITGPMRRSPLPSFAALNPQGPGSPVDRAIVGVDFVLRPKDVDQAFVEY